MSESNESYPYLQYPEAVILSSGPSSPTGPKGRQVDPSQQTNDHGGENLSKRKLYIQKFYESLCKICLNGDEGEEDRNKATTTRDYFLTALRHIFLENIPYPGTDEFRADSKFAHLGFVDISTKALFLLFLS